MPAYTYAGRKRVSEGSVRLDDEAERGTAAIGGSSKSGWFSEALTARFKKEGAEPRTLQEPPARGEKNVHLADAPCGARLKALSLFFKLAGFPGNSDLTLARHFIVSGPGGGPSLPMFSCRKFERAGQYTVAHCGSRNIFISAWAD